MNKEKISNKNILMLKVTTDTFYFFNTDINGWTKKEVIKNFFKNFPINKCHATRDTHEIGNSKILKKVKEISMDEYIKIKK
jgi:hypothetical protein